jgi:hypothetical protein
VISTGATGCVAFNASSQSRSGSRSPAFASSMIFCATASRVGATIRQHAGEPRGPSQRRRPGHGQVSEVRTHCEAHAAELKPAEQPA